MVERRTLQNNSYAAVALDAAGQMKLGGFGRQQDVMFE